MAGIHSRRKRQEWRIDPQVVIAPNFTYHLDSTCKPTLTPISGNWATAGQESSRFCSRPAQLPFTESKSMLTFEKAHEWCEGYATVPLVYVRLMVCEAIDLRDLTILAGSWATKRERPRKYMVLWKNMEPCYHSMCEFDHFEDALRCAHETRIQLQALKDSPECSRHGLPHTLRVLASMTVGEWNAANKPRGNPVEAQDTSG